MFYVPERQNQPYQYVLCVLANTEYLNSNCVLKYASPMCFQGLSDPRFFACYSLIMISIEKYIREKNLNIDFVIDFFHLNMVLLYRLGYYIGWDKMEFWRVSDDPL